MGGEMTYLTEQLVRKLDNFDNKCRKHNKGIILWMFSFGFFAGLSKVSGLLENDKQEVQV